MNNKKSATTENKLKTYSIKVGKQGRRGNFILNHETIINCSDSLPRDRVFTYFREKYTGFDVFIEEVPVIEIEDVSFKSNESNYARSIQFLISSENHPELWDLTQQYRDLAKKTETLLKDIEVLLERKLNSNSVIDIEFKEYYRQIHFKYSICGNYYLINEALASNHEQ